MNYLQIFAKGGKIDSDFIKKQIRRIFIEDEQTVNNLWQNAVQEYGSEENVIAVLLDRIGDNNSDESVQKAMMEVFHYVPMEQSQETSVFKCGGKLEQLINKFGNGGACGCNKVRFGQEGFEMPDIPTDLSDVEYHARSKYPFSKEVIGSLKFADKDGNTILLSKNGDGKFTVRKGREWLDFDANQEEAFIPYSKFKTFDTGNKGSKKLSKEDKELLDNLFESASKPEYLEPTYSWDSSLAKRFWYWLKSTTREKDLQPGAPTVWEQKLFKCGGVMKDARGKKVVSKDKSISIIEPNTALADTVGRYSYPTTNGKFKMLHNGERTATVWDNTGGFPIARYANETFIRNNPVKSLFYKEAPAGYFENLVERVNNRFDENGIPIEQEGGELDINNLTRRQARELATQNKGYNGEQFNYAMANVKNALRRDGLRGRELRANARRIVSGAEPQIEREPLLEKLPAIETNRIDGGFVNKLAGSRPTGSADQLSFNDRFRLARGMGDKTFTWRGKSYGTQLAQKPIELPEVEVYSSKLPEVTVYGKRQQPETHITGYLGTMLPEVEVVGQRKQPESHVTQYLGTMLPEVNVVGHKQPESHYTQYLGTQLPEVEVIGHKPAPETHIMGYLGEMLPEVNVTAQKQKPESYYTQYLGTMLPEVTVNGYRNVQTQVPMSKCGGKVESAKCGCKAKAECGIKLKPAMKCGGKTKKKK